MSQYQKLRVMIFVWYNNRIYKICPIWIRLYKHFKLVRSYGAERSIISSELMSFHNFLPLSKILANFVMHGWHSHGCSLRKINIMLFMTPHFDVSNCFATAVVCFHPLSLTKTNYVFFNSISNTIGKIMLRWDKILIIIHHILNVTSEYLGWIVWQCDKTSLYNNVQGQNIFNIMLQLTFLNFSIRIN